MEEHEQLVARAQRGHSPSVGALLERHLPGLLVFIRLRASSTLRARESTSDLAQSACRELLEDMGGLEFVTEGAFRHWLYRAAERKISDRVRFHHRERRDVRREALRPVAEAEEQFLLATYTSAFSPSALAIRKEALQRVDHAFEALPENYREVILLKRVVGLSHAEMARHLNITEGAGRQLLSRALRRLAALLGPEPL